MTLFLPDTSNNNWGSNQDVQGFVSNLGPQGFSAILYKVSEGSYYEDPFAPITKAAADAAGLPSCGYHYVTTDDPNDQAQTFAGNGGGVNAMFDFEANSGDLDNLWNVANAFNAININVALGYIPQWYLNNVGGDLSALGSNGIALISSAYPGGTGYASSIYASGGGDQGEGWQPYAGGKPVIWQFTDRASVAGFVVDCNAYLGDPDGLRNLLTGAAA